jgi:predicted  nucleic acid-binding Zn-ribbon protein
MIAANTSPPPPPPSFGNQPTAFAPVPPAAAPLGPPPAPLGPPLSPADAAIAPAVVAPTATAASAMAQLDEMPTEAPAGFFSGLPYLFKVMGARRKRAAVIRTFKREITTEERKLDEILRDLGKRVRELQLQHGPIEAEMAALLQLEGQRGVAEQGKSELGDRLKQDEERFAAAESECQGRIQAAQGEVDKLQAALNERTAEQRGVKTQLAEHDKQLKQLTGQRDSRTAQATKAKDDAQREGLEQSAAELAVQIGDLERQRETIAAQVAALDAPVAELTATLTTWRGNLQAAQKDLATAKQALATSKREIGTEERKAGVELTRLEKEIAQKFLDVGRVLDGSRVANPAFEELYGRIDETRGAIQTRQAQISQLEAERDSYDHTSAKHGKIMILSIAGFIVAVTITLIILFVFVFD